MSQKMENKEEEKDTQVDDFSTGDSFDMQHIGSSRGRRKFSSLQLIGSAYTVTNSWLGVAGAFTTGITAAGSASIIYGLLLMFTINLFVGIALSELISAMPNSGGQYYWVMRLAPKRYARGFSYMTGICNLCAAYCVTTSSSIAVSSWIFGSAKLAYPDLAVNAWRIYLGAMGLNIIAAIVNLWQHVVSRSVSIGLWLSLFACISLTIALPTASREKTELKFIFASLQNNSGWSSDTMAFIVGLINPNFAFAALDSATHLAEETPDPARNVPKAIIFTVVIGFLTSFPFACMLMYTLTDLTAVINTPTGVPLLELFRIAFQSDSAALATISVVAVTYFFSLLPQQAYQSRLCWALSRDHGLPFSRYWSQIHPTSHVPLHAHLVSVCIIFILGLLYIVSTTAFSSLITGVITFSYLTYLAPCIFSLLRGEEQPRGPFNVGWLGNLAKIITVIWCLFAIIMYSFPYQLPVTTSNMNYITAIYGVVLIFGIMDWLFRARFEFAFDSGGVDHTR
ncbi:Amino acid/polyamine transporter I [Penicillium griseofulvum]|uniref:Amino acid/polyamine transporter I n=1 Tax=Penicillium patulum TaxID=5078 RepID=A0A135LLA0_PENPA|nr:Amino acid/polyamine transporter I [Penicillium griseofulvum]KXG49766.1 Amino acid/polyamine transporter I [Penicillium griseofulvum]